MKKNITFICFNLSLFTPNWVKKDPLPQGEAHWVPGGTAPLTSRRSAPHLEAQHHLPQGAAQLSTLRNSTHWWWDSFCYFVLSLEVLSCALP